VKNQLLDMDVRLLVLRYGRQRVLDALARLDEETFEQVEQRLTALEQKSKSERPTKSKPSLIETAASASRERPEIVEPLRTLAVSFENRIFLPNLRDVRRFLARIGASSGNLKSRAVAGSTVIRALSTLSREELLKLAVEDALPRESDYALLSRAIMGTSTVPQRDKE